MEIMVSVCCLVYNHEQYLRKTLEGFVNQRTTFGYEVIIHDDASTDGSAQIIKEYCQKYPDLFRPIYQTENQYSKHAKIRKTYIYPLCRGKYIASCEGDDYWCDEQKLQLQVEYMENHQECSMCVHDTALIDPDGNFLNAYVNGRRRDCNYTAEDIIKANGGGLFQTSAVLAKRQVLIDRPTMFDIKGIGDYPSAIYAGVIGPVHYIGRVMSCYRVGHIGSWVSRLKRNRTMLIQQRKSEYDDLTRIDRETGYRYKAAFEIARGQRLFELYRIEYGMLKLLAKPADLWLVLRAVQYKVFFKMKRTLGKGQ